jgi:hypothetical protein
MIILNVELKKYVMSYLKVFLVATSGSLFLQAIEPGQVFSSGESPRNMVLRMLITVAGGVISTLAYKGLAWIKRAIVRKVDVKRRSV